MSKKRKGLDEVVESLIDVVYNGKITENEDGTYAVLEDPVQSTSRIISADRMEAKSPMQQDEDEEDPIPSSSIRDPVQLTSRESPMPTEGAGGPAEALEGSTKGRRRKGAGVQDLEFVLPPQRNEEENVELSSHHQFLVDVLSSIELITSANHNRGARCIVTQVLESCEGRLKKIISLGVVEEISSICASLYRYIRVMNWWLDDLTLPMT